MSYDADVQVVGFPHGKVRVEDLADTRVDNHMSLQTET